MLILRDIPRAELSFGNGNKIGLLAPKEFKGADLPRSARRATETEGKEKANIGCS